jgi:hypothetical protein
LGFDGTPAPAGTTYAWSGLGVGAGKQNACRFGARRIKAGPAAGARRSRRTRDDEPMTARTIEPVVWALEMCAGFLSKRDQTQAGKNDWTNVLYSSPRRLDGDAGSINNLNRHIVEGLFQPMSRAVNEVSCLENYRITQLFFPENSYPRQVALQPYHAALTHEALPTVGRGQTQ